MWKDECRDNCFFVICNIYIFFFVVVVVRLDVILRCGSLRRIVFKDLWFVLKSSTENSCFFVCFDVSGFLFLLRLNLVGYKEVKKFKS